MSPFDSGRDERADPRNVILAKQAVSKRYCCEAQTPEIVIPAKQAVSKRYCCEAQTPEIVIPAKQAVSKRYCCEAQTPEIVIPAKQAVSKRYCCEAQTPEIVIPAKAGIQGGLGRGFLTIPRRRVVCHNPSFKFSDLLGNVIDRIVGTDFDCRKAIFPTRTHWLFRPMACRDDYSLTFPIRTLYGGPCHLFRTYAGKLLFVADIGRVLVSGQTALTREDICI